MGNVEEFRYEFVHDDVFVLDGDAGVVHRLTGESAESVREARDEVSRRRAIKMALATGAGVVTMMLPAAAAAASPSPGVTGTGGTSGGSVLAAPTGLAVTTQGDTEVALSWNTVTGASSYVLYYRAKPAGLWSAPIDTGAVTSRNVTELINGTTYEFKVAAKNATSTGTESSVVEGTPVAPSAPGAPTNLAAVVSGTTATVSWEAPSGAAVRYYVLTSRRSDLADIPDNVSTMNPANSGVNLSNLTKGKTYVVTVTAVNGGGSASATVNAYVPNPPAAPTGFTTARGVNNGEVVLSWGLDALADSYTIQWKESTAGSYSPSDTTTGLTGTTYTKSGLTAGTTYDFQIKAVNDDGESTWVSDTATTRNKPNAPTSVSATAGAAGTSASVTWSEPSGGGTVDSYSVSYRLASADDVSGSYTTSSSSATSAHTVTGLTPGAVYVFRVTATNTDGSTSASTSSVTMPNPPNAPSSVSAVASGTGVSVTWGVPVGGGTPTSYRVAYRLAGDADTEANYTSVSTNATSPTSVANLAPGSSYVFRVTSVNSDGTASASSSSTAILNPPGNPQDVTATGSNTQVVLAWSAPGSGGTVSSYTVVHGPVGGSMTTVTDISSATTSQTYTGLTNGTTYQYTITAVGADGSSSGVTVLAIPVTTNQVTAASATSTAPISTLTTSSTAASLTVDSDGTGYQYVLDGGSAVSVGAGSTTAITLNGASHTLVVRKTLNGAEVEAVATLTRVSRTGSTSATTTLFIPRGSNGVRSVGVSMIGGTGGAGGKDAANLGGSPGQPGRVTGTMSVDAGDNLQYAAGSGGGNGADDARGTGGGSKGTNPMDGYDGGAGGNPGGGAGKSSGAGGGGGAATVLIRSGGSSATVVAAGSGGGGGGAGNGAGENGLSHLAITPARTDGGDGGSFAGDDGAGSAGGGGGAVGGAGGARAVVTEGRGSGGPAGSNSTGSIATLTAASATGRSTGSSGELTLTFYEISSITGTSVLPITESSLAASTPVSGTAPSATVSVQALSGNKSVLVSWSAVTGATDYLVYFRRNGLTTWNLAGTTSGTSLGVKGLVNGLKYDFAVRTRIGANMSGLSSSASATPSATVTDTPISAATTTPSLATFTLDNLDGCTYTYTIDSGTVTGATGTTSFTAPLSGLSHTVVVTKGYYDGTSAVITTKTVTLAQTTNTSSASTTSASYAVPSGNYGPRAVSVSLIGGKGGKGGNDGAGGVFSGGNGGDPGQVSGTLAVQAGDVVAVYRGAGGSGGSTGSNSGGGAGGTNAYGGYAGGNGANAGGSGTSGGGGGGGAASVVARTRSGSTIVQAVAFGGGGGGGAGNASNLVGENGRNNGTESGTTIGQNGFGPGSGEDGGGGGGGGGGARGGIRGVNRRPGTATTGEFYGEGGSQGTSSTTGLSSATTGTATERSNSANGEASITYYTVSGAA